MKNADVAKTVIQEFQSKIESRVRNERQSEVDVLLTHIRQQDEAIRSAKDVLDCAVEYGLYEMDSIGAMELSETATKMVKAMHSTEKLLGKDN